MSKEKEPLFSAGNLKLATAPLGRANPITVSALGICSALAVTVRLEYAVVMALAITVVAALSNLVISLIRNTIPGRIRIIVQPVIVAALVILVNQVLQAFAYEVSKPLSVFVGLIVTSCIVMGRIEAFALANKPWPSFIDGLGTGLGYGLILVVLGLVRELFGSGTVWGYQLVPKSFYVAEGGFYENNGFVILPPMALILVGIIVWVQRSRNKSLADRV